MKFSSHILHYLGNIVAGRYEPEGVRVLSNLYWRTLIVTALLVLTFVFLYSMGGLLRVLDDLGAVSGISAPSPSVLNRATLDAVVGGFEKRQEQFDLLKKNRGAAIPDPSR